MFEYKYTHTQWQMNEWNGLNSINVRDDGTKSANRT